MGFARRSALRAAVNRRIQFTDTFVTTVDSILVKVGTVTALKSAKGKTDAEDTYAAGSLLEVESAGEITAHDKVISVKYPAILYEHGSVSGAALIDQHDGPVKLKCFVTLHKDLPYVKVQEAAFKLYVEGE